MKKLKMKGVKKMSGHNGHRSWNAWNVSLWINNDETLYSLAADCLEHEQRRGGTPHRISARAALRFMAACGKKPVTPDGATMNRLCVSLVMADMHRDQT